jgi:hypothetical protein
MKRKGSQISLTPPLSQWERESCAAASAGVSIIMNYHADVTRILKYGKLWQIFSRRTL